MILISDGSLAQNAQVDKSWPFFRLAFRPLFWLGALFSLISILVWTLTVTGNLNFMPYGGGHFWHLHEMLFGFAAAIIVGFLLTAVQTWTKVPSVKGPTLMLLVAIWLLARVFMALPSLVPTSIIVGLDILFLPLAALFLARPILKAQKWRNLMFVPILLVMGGLNGLMHMTLQGSVTLSYLHLSHVMVMMVALVMCIMGGRVFPMFTANGTRTPRVPAWPWLEQVSMISVLLSVIVVADLFALPNGLAGAVLLLAGISNLVRAVRWRIWVTWTTPLVWPLHLSYWSVALGLILLGLVKLGVLTNVSMAIHTITVGGMGVMILAMISRVSLGHTGRFIEVGKVMTLAFVAIVLAMLVRVVAYWSAFDYQVGLAVSAGLWILAYGLFVIKYAPVLFRPRVDGGPG